MQQSIRCAAALIAISSAVPATELTLHCRGEGTAIAVATGSSME